MYKFQAKLQKFGQADLWHYYFSIHPEIAERLIQGRDKRVLCSLNSSTAFHCAIMNGGDGHFFINLNKQIREKHSLSVNDEFSVELSKDTSEFGMPFPEEFREVLLSDELAGMHFEGLTAGRKRQLIYLVQKLRSGEKRVEKSLIIAEHLKKFRGTVNFKALNEAFKNGIL